MGISQFPTFVYRRAISSLCFGYGRWHLPSEKFLGSVHLPLLVARSFHRRTYTCTNESISQNVVHKAVSIIVPLSERTESHPVDLKDFLTWKNSAEVLAASVGSRFFEQDGGPTVQELLTELDWYLDDAIANYQHIDCQFGHGFYQKEGGWRDLKRWISSLEDQSMVDLPKSKVFLRSSMESLNQSWRARILTRRPFQYVVGCAHWRDLVLTVQEGVLIPRPETEQLIDLASAAIGEMGWLKRGVWADLGTGSGAIAIGLARLLEADGLVFAVDMSDVAVAVATHNVQRYGLQARVKVVQGSWFSPIQGNNLVGLISNPPYIPSKNISDLQREVGKHEPHCALDGGPDGKSDLFLICEGSASAICSGGFLALETNGGKQAQAVAEFLTTDLGTYFCDVKVVNDYTGISRFVIATHQ